MLIHVGYPCEGRWLQRAIRDNASMEPIASEEEIARRLIEPSTAEYDAAATAEWFCSRVGVIENTGRIPLLSCVRLVGTPFGRRSTASTVAKRLSKLAPDATILLLIREQRAMILQLYVEYVRGTGAVPLQDFLGPARPAARQRFFRRFLEYDRVLSSYAAHYPDERILVRTHEELAVDPLPTLNRVFAAVGARPIDALGGPAPPSGSTRISRVSLGGWSRRIDDFLDKGFGALNRLSPGPSVRWCRRLRRQIHMDPWDYGPSNLRTTHRTGLRLSALGYRCSRVARAPRLLGRNLEFPASGPVQEDFQLLKSRFGVGRQCYVAARSKFGTRYPVVGLEIFLKKRIERSLADGQPASFIRLVDGEGSVLAAALRDYPALAEYCARLYSLRHFGTEQVMLQHFEELHSGLRRAISNASVIGIHPYWVLGNRTRPVFGFVLNGFYGVYEYCRRFGDELGLQEATTCLPTFHLRLLRSLPDLLKGRDIGLVSCHENLVPAFKRHLGVRSVDFHRVPEQALIRPGEFENTGHFPGRYRGLLAELDATRPGRLYLVGAGIPGKVYCEAIRAAGGIAVDFGSALDLLAGVRSRMHYDRIESRKLAIV